jgi:heme exporter protein D
MNSENFWAMGGYGLYVWGAYGFALLVFVGEALQLCTRKRALHKRLRAAAQNGKR